MKKQAKKTKKGVMSTVFPKSPLDEYYHPTLSKIAIEINADDDKFIPQVNNDGIMVMKAKDPATLPHRSTAVVDCGFSLKLMSGWKITINNIPQWASKGLIVTTPKVQDGRIKIYVTNVGKEIISIKADDDVAQISIEPAAYAVDWRCHV